MKNLMLTVALMMATAGLAGCGDGFPDEEMHFGIEDKVRPYAVVIEPAEAAPGQTVRVTLFAYVPDPDELEISWRVALDFNTGIYETDEVERNIRALPPLPAPGIQGFMTQTFLWTVPDSALLYSSALPEVLTDPVMVALATELLGPSAGSPPTKSAVDAWLKTLSPYQMDRMDPVTREAAWALSDRFACRVRFRATLRTGRVIEVTRNLSIRHTDRLGGPNANANAQVRDFGVVMLDKEDATSGDIGNPGVEQTFYPFINSFGQRVRHTVRVPLHSDRTYYLMSSFVHEQYTSPFDPTRVLSEQGRYRWYYYRVDDPLADHHLFVTDDGGEAEMWDLGGRARIQPDGIGSWFRVVDVVRDERDEWVSYQAVPGTAVEWGEVEFVAPDTR